MINSNNLSNRLNNIRDGKNVPTPIKEEYNKQLVNIDTEKNIGKDSGATSDAIKLGMHIFNLVSFIVVSFVYGYSINLIFSMGLTFINYFIIGVAIKIFTTKIFNIFDK